MSTFQAIVVRPLGTSVEKKGRKVDLKVWMPPVLSDVDIKNLSALQQAYDGQLEIAPKPHQGRALIIHGIIAYSRDSIRNAALKLAADVQKHLGIPTTIQ